MKNQGSIVEIKHSCSGAHPCPICCETVRQPVFVARDPHTQLKGQWTIARCAGCGLMQLDPMLTNEELSKFYPIDYYSFQDHSQKRRSIFGRLKDAVYKWQKVGDPKFEKPGRVLDSGCGSGWSLVAFKERGWECFGVDPSPAAIEVGRKQHGLDLKVGTVVAACYPDEYFDYVRSNHSLEHDPDCAVTLREFRRIIKPGGKLLIGVPNIESVPGRLFREHWWSLCPPVHTYSFSPRHLTRMLLNAGFEVEQFRYCGNWGGVLGSLQIRINASELSLTAKDGFLVNSILLKVIAQCVAVVLNCLRQGDWIEVIARPKISEALVRESKN